MRDRKLTGAGYRSGLVDLDANGLLEQLLAKSPSQRIHELERLICHTLASALRIETSEIQSDESLVGLGLNSLIGMNLRSKLEKALRTELPELGLSGCPTVEGLARVAAESIKEPTRRIDSSGEVTSSRRRDGKRRRSRSGVVALGGAHGPQTPLFCLHPVGGDLRCYDKLSRHLKTRPVFGLRSRGLDAYSEPHSSIDSMISDYADEIEKVYGRDLSLIHI